MIEGKSDLVELDATLPHETEKVWLVSVDGVPEKGRMNSEAARSGGPRALGAGGATRSAGDVVATGRRHRKVRIAEIQQADFSCRLAHGLLELRPSGRIFAL